MFENQELEVEIEKLQTVIFEKDTLLNQSKALIESQTVQIIELQEMITLLRHMKFGPKSEKLSKLLESAQFDLFNEAEELGTKVNIEEESVKTAPNRGSPKRRPLPENLPREDNVIDLSEEEKQCPCGCKMDEIGAEISEKLDVIPAQFKVIRTIRKTYACKKCEQTIKTAPVEAQLIPKSITTAGLIAYIVHHRSTPH